jgi:hypothetical protein
MTRYRFGLGIAFIVTSFFSVAHAQIDPSNSPGPGWVFALPEERSWGWVHMPSRVRDGNVVGVWLLHNYASPMRDVILQIPYHNSIRAFVEFDCSRRRTKGFHYDYYAGLNAKDLILMAEPPSSIQWYPVAPDTWVERIMHMACRR